MEFKAIDRTKEGDTLLRQCQLKELYLLEVFKEICEKHNLRYFLAYGTLLGAPCGMAGRFHGMMMWM